MVIQRELGEYDAIYLPISFCKCVFLPSGSVMIDMASLHGAGYRVVLREQSAASDRVRQADLFGPDGLINPFDDPVVVSIVLTERGSALRISDDVARRIDDLIGRSQGTPPPSGPTAAIRSAALLRIYSRLAAMAPAADENMLDRLGRLGDALLKSFGFAGSSELPKSMTKTPAAYTYLGQFLAHEMTVYHPTGSNRPPSMILAIDSAIDLKTIFLRPFNFPRTLPEGVQEAEGLILSETILDSGTRFPGSGLDDVPRRPDGCPILFEPRNDQNLAVSQTHVAVTRFAQAAMRILQKSGLSEDDLHRTVIRHFQSVVLQDYLPRIVDPETYADVMEHGRVYVAPSNGNDPLTSFYVPTEFSTAIFRFGHAMVQDCYAPWNTENPDKTVQSALASDLLGFSFAGGALTRGRLLQSWTTDWGHMLGHPGETPNMARAIGTALSESLFCLPEDLFQPSIFDRPCLDAQASRINLARRTLLAGALTNLPTGQTLAQLVQTELDRAGSPCRIPILPPDALVIPDNQHATDIMLEGEVGARFVDQTPLWVYILREAAICGDGNRLGPLGSRFVAETLSAAVEASGTGMIVKGIRQRFEPYPNFGGRSKDKFDYADLLTLAFNTGF